MMCAAAPAVPLLNDLPRRMLDFSCLRLFEWLDLPMWVFDSDALRIVWGNPAARTFWHASSDKELRSRDFSDLTEGTRTRLLQTMQRHAKGEVTRESWTLYPRGTPVTSELVSRGITLPDQRLGILFTAEPLAAGVNVDTLRGVEAVQHTTVRIAVHSLPHGKLLMRNPAAVQAFGPVKAPPQRGSVDFISLFPEPGVAARIIAQVRQGQTFSAEMELRTLQGLRWHGIDVRPVVDPGTGDKAMQVNARDISALKAVQQALESARVEADRANLAKSEFLANMSHEIRTPMNGVLGLTELVLRTELNATQRKYIELVNQSAKGLMVIINDLLDVAKAESGRMQLEQQPFSLRSCIDEALLPLDHEARNKHLNLYANIHPDVPDLLLGDAVRLRQVLVNLVGNALKFTEQGEVRTEVKPLGAADPAAEHVDLQFSVHDTGIGMSAEQMGHVFEPFVQADSSITRRYGGTGLGLAIVKRLVKLMGSEIKVQSAPGKGSCFSFHLRLPRQRATPSTAAHRMDDATSS
jgi:signal transduction histidine kinase